MSLYAAKAGQCCHWQVTPTAPNCFCEPKQIIFVRDVLETIKWQNLEGIWDHFLLHNKFAMKKKKSLRNIIRIHRVIWIQKDEFQAHWSLHIIPILEKHMCMCHMQTLAPHFSVLSTKLLWVQVYSCIRLLRLAVMVTGQQKEAFILYIKWKFCDAEQLQRCLISHEEVGTHM